MPKRFGAFDIDGTFFKSSLVEKMIDESVKDGMFAADAFADAYELRRSWQQNNNEAVYVAYLGRLVGAFIQQMAGVEVARFERVRDRMLAEHQVRQYRFPRELAAALRPARHLIALSGSPDALVEPFLRDLSFDTVLGSQYDQHDGHFTGVARALGDKALLLRGLVDAGEVDWEDSVLLGDTMGDATALEYVARPCMFNPSRTLEAYGRELGWPKVHEVKDNITALTWNQELSTYIEVDYQDLIATLAA